MKLTRALFVGRFQPFHDGHKAVINKALETNDQVVIAMMDTAKDERNPYSFRERERFIWGSMTEEMMNGQVQIVKIPQITEMVYGRDVGYGIRQIELDPETESISATKIRKGEEDKS